MISTNDPEQGACLADLSPKGFKDYYWANSNFTLNFHYKNTGGRDGRGLDLSERLLG